MISHKKKAFTLTELLVVIIVIGVLSAVLLPKFSKVLETRKTTEAEELMSAVRTEQEKRCSLDKSYLMDLSRVTDIVSSPETKNFSLHLTPTGIEAKSKGRYGYTLKMPSYQDGRMCCEEQTECAKLNKDYPLCSELIVRADYQSGAACAGDGSELAPEPEPEPDVCDNLPPNLTETKSCGGNFTGQQTRRFNTDSCAWGEWDASSCGCALSPQSEPCGEGFTGSKTRPVNSVACEYEAWDVSSCKKEELSCTDNPNSEKCCRDPGFFINNMSLCCNNMSGDLFDYLFDEGYPNCCAYKSVFNNHVQACCSDGTVPDGDMDKHCYDVSYRWEAIDTVERLTYCSWASACWDSAPVTDYKRCSKLGVGAGFSCTKQQVGDICWEDNGEYESCGLETFVETQNGGDGSYCTTYSGRPLVKCQEDRSPLY